jgi:N-acetylmuramoyl-L-alanine amidase
MATIHVVVDGEHLPGIAAKFGFSSFRTILDHPENAEIKKQRSNPNVLVPGDRIFIPDRELRNEDAATGQRHQFVRAGEVLELRVKVLDLSEKALPGPCELAIELARVPMTESQNIFTAPILPDATRVAMEFTTPEPGKSGPQKFPLFVGGLDDIKEFSGQQQRLNNLGYFAGFSAKSTAQFKWAVEEFQADKQLVVDGVCGPATQKALLKAHGV